MLTLGSRISYDSLSLFLISTNSNVSAVVFGESVCRAAQRLNTVRITNSSRCTLLTEPVSGTTENKQGEKPVSSLYLRLTWKARDSLCVYYCGQIKWRNMNNEHNEDTKIWLSYILVSNQALKTQVVCGAGISSYTASVDVCEVEHCTGERNVMKWVFGSVEKWNDGHIYW